MSTSSLQWVVSAYVLGYGGFLLLGGRAADLLGRRRVFLIALAVFIVASALGGLADDGTVLIITRFIKGVSAAFTAPAALSIITTTFAEGPARNRALAIFTATGATGLLARARDRRPPDRDRLALGVLPAGTGGARRAHRRAAARPEGPPGAAPRSRLVRPLRSREPDRGDAAARIHARRGAERGLPLARGRSARSLGVAAILGRLRRAGAAHGLAARPARDPARHARSCGRTSPRCRCSGAGSGSSSSSRCTCSSSSAGRRSRPGSRSSRPG